MNFILYAIFYVVFQYKSYKLTLCIVYKYSVQRPANNTPYVINQALLKSILYRKSFHSIQKQTAELAKQQTRKDTRGEIYIQNTEREEARVQMRRSGTC